MTSLQWCQAIETEPPHGLAGGASPTDPSFGIFPFQDTTTLYHPWLWGSPSPLVTSTKEYFLPPLRARRIFVCHKVHMRSMASRKHRQTHSTGQLAPEFPSSPDAIGGRFHRSPVYPGSRWIPLGLSLSWAQLHYPALSTRGQNSDESREWMLIAEGSMGRVVANRSRGRNQADGN